MPHIQSTRYLTPIFHLIPSNECDTFNIMSIYLLKNRHGSELHKAYYKNDDDIILATT
jgi:hypothetical protein